MGSVRLDSVVLADGSIQDLGLTTLIVWSCGGGGTGYLRHCRNVGLLYMSVAKHSSSKLQCIQFPEHMRIFEDVHRIYLAELRLSCMKTSGIWPVLLVSDGSCSTNVPRTIRIPLSKTFPYDSYRRKQRLKYAVHILIAQLESFIV